MAYDWLDMLTYTCWSDNSCFSAVSADIHLHDSGEILDIVCDFDLSSQKKVHGRPRPCVASRRGPFYGKSCTGLLKHYIIRFRLRRVKSSKLLQVTFVFFTIFIMDLSFGQSTWPLLFFKTLSSALNLGFYLAFSATDSQPTRPLGKENTGSPQPCLEFGLFCFMGYIHDQLTLLLQTTSFQIFLVLMFFFMFFVVVHTYHCRSINKQPPSSQSSRYIFKSHLFFIFSHLFVLQTFQKRT